MSTPSTLRPGARTGAVAIGALLAACALVARPGHAASGARTTQTVYAVATRAQFVDDADDVARGSFANPFGIDVKSVPPKPNGKNPLPGDSALFEFKLYASPSLRSSVGTGSYTCTFGFAGVGFCEATFDVSGSTLFGSGSVSFSSFGSGFTLALSGGTNRYFGKTGEVVASTPSAGKKNESVLRFILVS